MVESPLADAAVRHARPLIEGDGALLERANELLLGLEVSEQEGGLGQLELRVINVASLPEGRAELAFEDERELALGSALKIGMGDRTRSTEVFRGLVTGLEAGFDRGGPPSLTVLAEDTLARARETRRTRVFADATPADLARRIAADHGLEADVEGLAAPRASWVQHNESDLAFLRRALGRVDGELQVVADRLVVRARGDQRRGEVGLRLGGQLIEARFTADLAHQATRITVAGFDLGRGRRVRGDADAAAVGAGTPRSGPTLRAQVIGEREEHLAQLHAASGEEADGIARAALSRRAQAFVRVDGVAAGNPALRVGSTVEIEAVSARFDGRYRVVAATHRYDRREGYRTSFVAERPALGSPA